MKATKKIENFLDANYENAEEMKGLLERTNLISILDNAIERIEEAYQSNNLESIVGLSGVILTSVNAKISALVDPKEKESLEYLLADIFQAYLDRVAADQEGMKLLSQISTNLRDACDLMGYDYKALAVLINIEKRFLLIPRRNKKTNLHYDWKANSFELDELSRDICDKDWICSVKEFKQLFNPINTSLQVQCNPKHRDKLLILFDVLGRCKIIRPRGISGHFAPFVQYAMDNEGRFLFENRVNKYHANLQRNASKYQASVEIVEKVILGNVSKTLRQWKDNGHCTQLDDKLKR